MCGRAAQTSFAVTAAAQALGATAQRAHPHAQAGAAASNNDDDDDEADNDLDDNYNMSPGMNATVIYKQQTAHGGKIVTERKVWGLITKAGTAAHPLTNNMSAHFSNLMFNARSDTLFQKPTFARLANSGNSCLIALDGFYEWKLEGKNNKQPYFVYRNNTQNSKKESHNKDRPYLLMAGLYTSVPTGAADGSLLHTFCILTTDVCQPLAWLHTRMPVCIWDESLARAWLDHPSPATHKLVEEASTKTPDGVLQWHAVTPNMSSLKYRSKDSIRAVPQPQKLTAFFGAVAKPKIGSHKEERTSTNDADTKDAPSDWTCPYCTLLNSASHRTCQACQAGSPRKRSPPPTIPSTRQTKKAKTKGPLDAFVSRSGS
jgi:putative SOS response-associated peptidase YedK